MCGRISQDYPDFTMVGEEDAEALTDGGEAGALTLTKVTALVNKTLAHHKVGRRKLNPTRGESAWSQALNHSTSRRLKLKHHESLADVAHNGYNMRPYDKGAGTAVLSSGDVVNLINKGSGTGGAGRHWILDPVDGTLGFVRGDQYAIALAMMEAWPHTIPTILFYQLNSTA